MRSSSPYRRAALLGVVTVGILVLILRWSNPSGTSGGSAPFTTPEACLEAFRDAKSEGNARWPSLLGEPVRSKIRGKYANEQDRWGWSCAQK